ncbi:MAG: SMC-Scp complex subunit ScpB [Deltaproteobacteria bacterium]|nr:SMC-Scp complex subunit ScpB [Deltaproteobacteria bacterium]
MDREALKSIVEGLIFAHPEPIGADSIAKVVQGASSAEIQSLLDELEHEYLSRSRGFMLARIGDGYQFRSLPGLAPWILEMKKVKPARLSRAALETLAIVAYNQPITRNRIEQIRGVESSGTVRNLIERDLITVVGRKDIPGRPLLYGTSRRFLEVFGLADLTCLPALPEIEALKENTE